MENWKYSSSHS